MYADNGCVDHLDCRIMRGSERSHDLSPDASPSPTNEAVVAGGVRAVAVREITPRRARPQDPKDAVQNTAVIQARIATRLVRQHWLDGGPFIVGEFVAHDLSPQLGGLNHGRSALLNITHAADAQPAHSVSTAGKGKRTCCAQI